MDTGNKGNLEETPTRAELFRLVGDWDKHSRLSESGVAPSQESRPEPKSEPKSELTASENNAVKSVLSAPVEIRKADGALVQMRDGLVCSVQRGADSLTIEYEKKDGKVVFDQNGACVLSIKTRLAGVEQELCQSDFAAGQAQIRVKHTGEGLGQVAIVTGPPESRCTSTLHTDFSRVDRDTVCGGTNTASGTPDYMERIRALYRPDGSSVAYNYSDENNPTKLTQVIETYRTSMGNVSIKTMDRIGDSEKFVTHTQNTGAAGPLSSASSVAPVNSVPTWRTDVKLAADGELIYRELNETFWTPPPGPAGSANRLASTGQSDLDFQREELLKTATANGVFKGNENTILSYMNAFERRSDKFTGRGWLGADDLDIADSYSNLSRVFTDPVQGRARVVGASERRLLVESALKELASPERYINQGSIGTCSLNSVESNLANRRPQELCRWLREASTKGYVTSRGVNRNGEKIKIGLTERQLDYEPSWNRSYSNQLFQFAAIAALGYGSRGYDYGGTTNNQLNYVSRLACGQNMRILDNWMGYGARKSDIVSALKTRGSVAYIVPGHCMAIDDYDAATNRFYVNNWWGGSRDGWVSARSLGLR